MKERFIESMRGTPPPQKTAEQMLIDRIKSLEMDMRESSELNEHLRERIKRLEDIIKRAGCKFFEDGSDGKVAVNMLTVLDEAREAKP